MITGIEINQPTRINRIATGECLLSISLLVSNQRKTIRKCMESIRPLLEQVPSELIIVDTVGEEKSDGSLAIAREYADKIVHFTWCDDFAAARNAGLKECSGQWFMYMDDDEYFDDVTPLIDFFSQSELFLYYQTIEIGGRDYDSYNGNSYNYRQSIRLFRRDEDSYFEGKVHEHFVPSRVPLYTSAAFVHHFGYVHVYDKTQRNEVIIDEQLTARKDDFVAWLQLILGTPANQVLKKIALAEQALTFAKKDSYEGLEFFQQKALIEIIAYLTQFYQGVGQLSKAQALLENYQYLANGNQFVQGLFAYLQLSNDLIEGNTLQAVADFTKLQQMVAYFEENQQAFNELYTPMHRDKVSVSTLKTALHQLSRQIENTQDVELQLKLFKQLNWQLISLDTVDLVSRFMKASLFVQNTQTLKTIYQHCKAIQEEQLFIRSCQALMFTLKSEQKGTFRQMLATYAAENTYFAYQKALVHQDEALLTSIFEELKFYEVGVEELLIELIQRNIDVLALFKTASLDEIQTFCHFVDQFFAGDFESEAKFIEKIADNLRDSALGLYICYQLYKQMILKPSMPTVELINYLDNYLSLGQALVFEIYNENIYTNEVMLLPTEYHWLALLAQALQVKEQGNLAEYLHLLKQGLEIYPVAKDFITKLMTLAQRELRKQQSIEDELARLANQVKADILKLISEENYAEARAIYQELQQIVPNDESLKAIEQLLK